MQSPLDIATPHRPAMLLVAAPGEARAALEAHGADPALADRAWQPIRLNDVRTLVIAGVSKSNAAAATARFGADAACVINLGVAGALPGSPFEPGDVVLASRSIFADEGILKPDGYQPCAEMGFPLLEGADSPPTDPALARALAPLADGAGPIATVSTCSATDAAAREVARRTGGVAEAMEGAAVLLAAARLAVPAIEIRVISNLTGNRPLQRWDLATAFKRLRAVIGSI